MSMKKWLMPRGSGKTTCLIRESNRTGAVIVVHTARHIRIVLEKAQRMGLIIPIPLTFYEMVHPHSPTQSVNQQYLIDELELCLRDYGVVGYTNSLSEL